MNLSNRQKMAVHIAAKAAGYADARYRLILQNLAGVRSSKDPRLTRENYIRLMAFFEGECGGCVPGFTPGYWFGQDLRGDSGDSLRVACRREAEALGWSAEELDSFLASDRCTSGRCRSLAGAPVYWLSRCLDALKAMRRRAPAATVLTAENAKSAENDEVPF